MSGVFSAANFGDMRALAALVKDVPDDLAPAFAAALVEQGMMVPPWWARAMVWIGQIRHRRYPGAVWLSIFTRRPDMARDMLDQTADWILNGKDRVDPASVGGFNQGEADAVAYMLSFTPAKATPHDPI